MTGPTAAPSGGPWRPRVGHVPGAAFFDLDRTLLRRASGPALSEAMRETGVTSAALPLERAIFGYFDLFGETLGSIALARQGGLLVRGRAADAFDEAAEVAADRLAERVEPFARLLLDEHRRAGRPVVLATTTPEHLIRPFARRLGLDDVIGTRFEVRDGRFTGALDGPFVWSRGKLAAVRAWADEHDVDLADSYAYSDSVYDLPLLHAVGEPGAVNPDPRLLGVAIARRWPVLHFDTSPGVVKVPVVGLEVQQVAMAVARPELIPYARFEVEGVEHLPQTGGTILVGNHRSYFDVTTMLVAMRQAGRTGRFLGKKEIFDVPVLGQVMTALGGIRVDRQGDDDERDDPLVPAARAIAGGELVAILPEGTIPRGPDFFDPVLRGKPGAARLAALTRAPVVPFALSGTEQVWPRSARLPDVLALRRPPTVRVRFGPPVELKHRSEARDTDRIMAAIADLLPDELREPRRPTLAELARTYPDGVVPAQDRAFAVDG